MTTKTATRTRYNYERVQYVDPMPGRAADEVLEERSCGRCAGTGYVQYSTLDGSRCWACHATGGRYNYTVSHARADERKRVDRENRARLKAEKARLARTSFLDEMIAADPIWERLEELRTEITLLSDFAQNIHTYGSLTPRQAEVATKMLHEAALRKIEREAEAERIAALDPWTEGRQTVTVNVLSTKTVDSAYGTSVKMLVQTDEGLKAWGSVPQAIFWESVKGARVTFTAAFKPADDDAHFAFYSRPTKAEVVSTPADL